jgi:disulfide bond formation protein DsbB
MRSMKRPFVFALLLLAAILAVEPLLHEHPLQQSPDAVVCAACAAGTGQVAVAPPAVAAPLAVTYRLVAVTVACPSFDAPLSLPSRAPPAL